MRAPVNNFGIHTAQNFAALDQSAQLQETKQLHGFQNTRAFQNFQGGKAGQLGLVEQAKRNARHEIERKPPFEVVLTCVSTQVTTNAKKVDEEENKQK